MTMANMFSVKVVSLMKEREQLNQKRSAIFKEEGPGACLDKDYRLLCKGINNITAEINKLTQPGSIKL